MEPTSGRAGEAIGWLIGCIVAASPTGVAAQLQMDTVALHAAAPAGQGATLSALSLPAAQGAVAPDLATSSRWVAHAAPTSDAASRLAMSGATEPALLDAVLRALWPADIVQRSDDYLRRYPDHASAVDVLAQRQLAAATAGFLRRSDVELFRAAFVPQSPDGSDVDDLRRAALGDADAAFRLAQQPPVPDAVSRRRVGWLQYAALLGNDRAAYALSLHYRRASQPLLAAQFEARAVALGFQPPAGLDHARK